MGVPYPVGYENGDAQKDLQAQADADRVRASKSARWIAPADREIIALIAYLQRLGKDIKAEPAAPVAAATK